MSSGDTLTPKTVVDFLHEKEYSHVELLGKGGFGEVLCALSPKQENVAIKIIDNKKIWHIEESIWPVLRHKNILPLLETVDISFLNVKLFIMPKMPHVLDKMLYSKSFMIDKMGLKRVKRWLSACQDALKYLHTSGFAHLDLKQDNILISADDQALLCDFSGINLTGVPLRRLIAPLKFRPPEYHGECRYASLEGSRCDIWMYGLMALNTLTKDWPSRRMGKITDAQSWKNNVEPVLLEALKKNTFCNIMKATFPSVAISDEDITSGHNFVVSLLQWDQGKRPSIQEIERHPFLARSDNQSMLTEEILPKFKEVKSVVTNPFLKGWIDPDVDCKNSLEKDTENNAVLKCDFTNVVTNPFLDGWIGHGVINESTPHHVKENNKQNDTMKSYSHQHFGKMEITNKCKNALPIVAASKENIATKSLIDTCLLENELPKDKMKIGGSIKKWFVNKWQKAFKKNKNAYVRLSDESE